MQSPPVLLYSLYLNMSMLIRDEIQRNILYISHHILPIRAKLSASGKFSLQISQFLSVPRIFLAPPKIATLTFAKNFI